jgi:hypothetical protein
VLDSQADQAILVLHQCEVKGLAPDQARKLAYENLFLPSSEDWILTNPWSNSVESVEYGKTMSRMVARR